MANTTFSTDMAEQVDRDGFAVLDPAFDPAGIEHLSAAVADAARKDGIRRRGQVLAMRNLLESVPEVADLARSATMKAMVEAVLGPGSFAVRGILFDKTPETNWKVAWHQDLTIAVKRRVDVPGFGPWSEKAGVVSVQPPTSILEGMVTVRVNLDPCGADNGPVRVLPGSHRIGRLSAAEISRWRGDVPEVLTAAGRGGVLLMRPLLLHASSPAISPGQRRIIHIDFAAAQLPGQLEWHVQV
jgi:ectoine hydroxylase-related dioxygenase (phytanoyl-CoA dioxygenase family)